MAAAKPATVRVLHRAVDSDEEQSSPRQRPASVQELQAANESLKQRLEQVILLWLLLSPTDSSTRVCCSLHDHHTGMGWLPNGISNCLHTATDDVASRPGCDLT